MDLTIVLLGVIFLAIFFRRGPFIAIPPITLNASLNVPEKFLVEYRPLMPERSPLAKLTDEAIPDEILGYINQESDEWAVEMRTRRVRQLRQELGDWDKAFIALQFEDRTE